MNEKIRIPRMNLFSEILSWIFPELFFMKNYFVQQFRAPNCVPYTGQPMRNKAEQGHLCLIFISKERKFKT